MSVIVALVIGFVAGCAWGFIAARARLRPRYALAGFALLALAGILGTR